MMIDICVPFEDWEYNAVGHYRGYYVIAEYAFMIYLTVLWFRMRQSKTPTEMYVKNLLLISWPILPIRLLKTGFTIYLPLEASQSVFLCHLLRIETTLQYGFSLSHLLMLAYFGREVAKHRSVSFEVKLRMRRTLYSMDSFSFLSAFLFVNIQFSAGLVKIFSCIYALTFCIGFFAYCATHMGALIKSTCPCLRVRKEGDPNYFSYFWFFTLQFLATVAHLYHFCGISTFLIPAIFPQFAGDYLIIFRFVTGVLAVRFMVSIIFAAGPVILIPAVRKQVLKPILKFKNDRVQPTPELRSPDQIQVTFVN